MCYDVCHQAVEFENVTESIARAYYDGDWNKGPWEEETVPKYTGDWSPASTASAE